MKYVVVRMKNLKGDGHLELPFIFPEAINHDDMARAIAGACKESFGGATGAALPISAGFISSMEIGEGCHGESMTLGMKSRREVDDQLISMSDYGSMHK